MPEPITISLNGVAVRVPKGAMLSTAFLATGTPCRISVAGEPRTAVCGMGICFECRATIDGVAHQRTCQITCCDGMVVETQR